jgi:hypothetical protein
LRYKPDLQIMDLQDSVIIPPQNYFAAD